VARRRLRDAAALALVVTAALAAVGSAPVVGAAAVESGASTVRSERLQRLPVPPIVAPPPAPDGTDEAELPGRYPEAVWLPLPDAGYQQRLLVPGRVNGRAATVQLDTGSAHCVVGRWEAERLGVVDEARRAESVRLETAKGVVIEVRTYLADVAVGRWLFEGARVSVLDTEQSPFVVGYSLLRQLDVLLAIDEGLVGLFDAGAGPVAEGAHAVPTVMADDGVPYADVEVRLDGWRQRLALIIDSGADVSNLPERLLREARPVEGAVATFRSFSGRVVDQHYDAGEIELGGLPVGALIASSTPTSWGLLGLDVLARHRTLLSFSRERIFLWPKPRRPDRRWPGADGRGCERGGEEQPCLRLSVEPMASGAPRLCTDVGPELAGRSLALRVVAEDDEGRPAWSGATMTVFLHVPYPGGRMCFTELGEITRDPALAFARLSVERLFVPARSPCPTRSCLRTHAPLP
jgi:hypothetical protein